MANGLNKAILIGNLGGDPETRYTPNGTTITNFSIATSDSYTKDGEKHTKTEWHRIVTFGKLAEICGEYLHKGKQVYLEGKIQNRSWETDDGEKKYITEVVANKMIMLGGAKSGGSGGGGYVPPTGEDDDIPF